MQNAYQLGADDVFYKKPVQFRRLGVGVLLAVAAWGQTGDGGVRKGIRIRLFSQCHSRKTASPPCTLCHRCCRRSWNTRDCEVRGLTRVICSGEALAGLVGAEAPCFIAGAFAVQFCMARQKPQSM